MTQLAVPNAPRKVDPRRERSSDDLRQRQGLLVLSQVSRQTAQLIFQPIYDGLEDLSNVRCIFCYTGSCNGFRNDHIAKMCEKRSSMVTHQHKMICFGCGGPHIKKDCSFRPKTGRPEVLANVARCYLCFLPQHAQCGYSFHGGEAGLSGGSHSQNAVCCHRGDQAFALLSAFYWSRQHLHELFMTCHEAHVAQIPPHHTNSAPAGGKHGFPRYWEWLWQLSSVGNSVRHLDIVLSFMLKQRLVFA